jgi:hypothetical protein
MNKINFYIHSNVAKSVIFAFLIFVLLSPLTTVPARAGGVTNIKEVLNETNMTVELRKYDRKPLAAASEFETTGEIPTGGGTWSGAMWVPWVDKSADFVEKHMEIVIGGRTAFWIWQSGEFIRYNTRPAFVENARRVAGESRGGGERRLIISLSGRNPVIEFERY